MRGPVSGADDVSVWDSTVSAVDTIQVPVWVGRMDYTANTELVPDWLNLLRKPIFVQRRGA